MFALLYVSGKSCVEWRGNIPVQRGEEGGVLRGWEVVAAAAVLLHEREAEVVDLFRGEEAVGVLPYEEEGEAAVGMVVEGLHD